MSIFYMSNKFTANGAVCGVLVIYFHYLLNIKCFVAVLAFGLLGTLTSSIKKKALKAKNNDSVKE